MNEQQPAEQSPTNDEAPGVMSLGEHLDELRKYIIRILLVITACFFVLLFFKEFLFEKIILAPREPWFFTNRMLCKLSVYLNSDVLCINAHALKLINIQLAGQFSAHMLVSLVASLIITFPVLLRQIWLFVKPALFPHEIKKFRTFISAATFLFLSGVSFGYFLVVPITINFLGTYQVSEEISNTITLMSYISTVSLITLIMGIVFQLPVLIYFITKAGLITPEFMKKNRKIIIVVIFIIAAIITPPDALSQFMVAVPMYILYEVSIFICRKNSLQG